MTTVSVPSNTIRVADLIARERLVINTNFLPDPGLPGRIVRVNPSTVSIDHSYQRKLNVKHATTIGQSFEFIKMKVPNGFINKDGEVLITDGQHTCVGAALAGIPEIDVFVVDIPESFDDQQAVSLQSKQFLGINTNQKRIGHFDLLNNKYIQRDPVAVAIFEACKAIDVTPCPSDKSISKRPGHISHVKNLETAWESMGREPTVAALKFIRKYWPNDPIDGGTFIGLARFYQRVLFAQGAGMANSELNESDLYMALSGGGSYRFDKVFKNTMEPLYSQLKGIKQSTAVDIVRAKEIRLAYNLYVKDETRWIGKFV